MERSKYLLSGEIQFLVSHLDRVKARVAQTNNEDSDRHCELMIMGFIGKELALEGIHGQEFCEKLLIQCTKLKALSDAEIEE